MNITPAATEKWIWCPEVEDLAAPTRAELTAGLPIITPGVVTEESAVTVSGWQTEASTITLTPIETLHDRTIPGRITPSTPSMTFYDSDSVHTVYDGLEPGDTGVMVRMPYGDVPTEPAECWPGRVNSRNRADPTSGDPSQFTVTFAVGVPEKDGVVPAAS